MTENSPQPSAAATEVSVQQVMSGTPDRVWSLISDVTRMGEWSPETTGCSWLKGATGPAVGARFKGNNQNGKKRWSTVCVVTQCEPAKRFVFDVNVGMLKIARWSYVIEPGADGTGCSVTETWTDRRGALVKSLGKPLSGVADRSEHNRAGMVATLTNLAQAAARP